MARETDDSSSPNKRLKTLNPQIESQPDPNQPETPPETDDSPPDRCAICFLDDGKAARGKIDCCDHYFCFLCIKEWAKTESRCPICRRRFNSIRRPPKVGVFVRERVVKVPVRDQGDKSGHVDAYEEVACNVCSSMTDDHFMLLCDLCDGAAHTYCVGLGYTVPEGDWFCNDCIASRPELANGNGEDECGMIPTEAVPVPCVSVSDIVREPNFSVVQRPVRITPNSNQSLVGAQVGRPAKAPPRVASISAESAARTLDRCRNVQTRIFTLRENWNGFRSGALSFPASSSKSKAGCSGSQGNGVMSLERSSQTESSLSPSRQELEIRGGCDPHDIAKAWKMLERAKPKQCIHKKNSSGVQLLQFSKLPFSRTSALKEQTSANPCPYRSGQQQASFSTGCQQNEVGCGSREIVKTWKIMDRAKLKQHVDESTSSALKLPSRKANASHEASNVNSSFNTLKGQQLGAPNQGRPEMEKVYKGKERQPRVTTQEAVESILGISCSNSSPGLFIAPYPRNMNRSASLQKNQPALSMVNEQNGSASSLTEGTSNSFCGKPELSTSSSGNLEEVSVESRARKVDDEAKSEIQSLVKMNLKLLSKDQRLGADAFKQIARAATHTVLAACGLEHHHKSVVHSSSSLVCRHTEQLQLPHKSNLMRKACRDCFYGFVKDVVSSILHNHDGFRLRHEGGHHHHKFSLLDRNVDTLSSPAFFLDQSIESVQIVGSDNGLVCLHLLEDGIETEQIVVWNPLTKQYKKLPKPLSLEGEVKEKRNMRTPKVGFGFIQGHGMDIDYKLVRISLRNYRRLATQVSTRSSKSWRELEDSNLSCFGIDKESSITLNGVLYFLSWTTYSRGLNDNGWRVFSFNLHDEVFHSIPLPSDNSGSRSLFAWNNLVACSLCSD
ncbi:hypothetical protein ACLB2K_044386 [Fragaria x ananassa]